MMNASVFAFWHLRGCQGYRSSSRRLVSLSLPFPVFLVLVCGVCGFADECVSSGRGRRALSSHLTPNLLPSHLAHLWLIYPSPPPAAALFNLRSSIPQRVCEHRAGIVPHVCFLRSFALLPPLFSCIHIYPPSWHLVTSEKISLLPTFLLPASTPFHSTHVLEATLPTYFFSVQHYLLSVSNSAFGLQLRQNSNRNTSHNFLKRVLTQQKSMTQRFLTLKEMEEEQCPHCWCFALIIFNISMISWWSVGIK